MKFTCSRDLLLDGLNIVQRAVPGKSNLSILEGVLLEVKEDVILTCTDSEVSINYQVGAIIEEIGSIVVSAKVLSEIVRRLPDIYVTCETSSNGSTLIITSGNAHFEISIMNADQYPKVNFIKDEDDNLTLTKNNFRNLVRQTAFAASIDSPRMILRGVLVENKENVLRFVAIDGFRLAVKTVASTYEKEFKIVVPAKVLNEVSRIIEKSEGDINFRFNENQIMFYNNTFKLIASLYKGEFADYEKMIPKEFSTIMKIGTSDISNSIERVSVVVDDDRKWPIIFKTYPDEIFISVAGEKGNSHEVLPAEISGQEIEIFFNEKNIIDCFKAIEKEKITISFTSQKGPCVIGSDEDDSFLMLVMPVKPKVR